MNLDGRTLCVTGVGGFIGLRVAELALARGMRVTGFDRDPAAVARARAAGVDSRQADITDATAVREAVAGSDVVLNTAAIVEEGGELEVFRKVNVEGAAIVGRAAREAGARCYVHLSSVMVYGFTFPRLVDEDGPKRGEGNPYCQTKIESEAAVTALEDRPGFGVIVIRPGDVYGPGSVPWVVRPLEMMRQGIFALPDGGRGIINHVYVDNLADGIFAAVEREAYGRAFNLTDGAETTFLDYFRRLAAAAGVKPPPTAPAWVLRSVGRAAQLANRLGLIDVSFAAQAVSFVLRPHPYSIERASRELDYAPRVDLDEGMRRVGEWLSAGPQADAAAGS